MNSEPTFNWEDEIKVTVSERPKREPLQSRIITTTKRAIYAVESGFYKAKRVALYIDAKYFKGVESYDAPAESKEPTPRSTKTPNREEGMSLQTETKNLLKRKVLLESEIGKYENGKNAPYLPEIIANHLRIEHIGPFYKDLMREFLNTTHLFDEVVSMGFSRYLVDFIGDFYKARPREGARRIALVNGIYIKHEEMEGIGGGDYDIHLKQIRIPFSSIMPEFVLSSILEKGRIYLPLKNVAHEYTHSQTVPGSYTWYETAEAIARSAEPILLTTEKLRQAYSIPEFDEMYPGMSIVGLVQVYERINDLKLMGFSVLQIASLINQLNPIRDTDSGTFPIIDELVRVTMRTLNLTPTDLLVRAWYKEEQQKRDIAYMQVRILEETLKVLRKDVQ